MLDALTLHNFKAFQAQKLEFKPLTLLTGLNGVGKSTVIQALLLLRQSYLDQVLNRDHTRNSGLVLNGDLVHMGTGFDLLNERAAEDLIQFSLAADRLGQVAWTFAYDRSTDVLAHKATDNEYIGSIYDTALFTDNFHYLQAERIGPRRFFDMADHLVRQRRQIGVGGQFAVHFLELYANQDVLPEMNHPASQDNTLRAQVEAWMAEISPGTQIDIDPLQNMDLVRLAFGFKGGTGDVRFFRPTNVGFGITYTLPVLVAILSSQPGGLVLLENPEAHIHPRGQAQIGNLLARAAAAGVQLIVETHSDHILNGIRIAAREGIVDPDHVALHFFQRSANSMQTKIVTPKLDKDGRIDQWPEHFFDEYGKSLRHLI